MSSQKVTATEAARNLSDLLNRVRYRREAFELVRGGEVVARLVPADEGGELTVLGLLEVLEALPRADDRFADDLEAVQAESQAMAEERDPWAT